MKLGDETRNIALLYGAKSLSMCWTLYSVTSLTSVTDRQTDRWTGGFRKKHALTIRCALERHEAGRFDDVMYNLWPLPPLNLRPYDRTEKFMFIHIYLLIYICTAGTWHVQRETSARDGIQSRALRHHSRVRRSVDYQRPHHHQSS